MFGIIAGVIVVVLSVIQVAVFLNMPDTGVFKAELFSKSVNIFLNLVGIISIVVGYFQVHRLKIKTSIDEEERAMSALDLSLIRITGFFFLVYLNLTIMVGAFDDHGIDGFPNTVHVANGVIEVIQLGLQTSFIIDVKRRIVADEDRESQPCRQILVWLFFFNLAQWLNLTLEVQKIQGSLVEASFFGLLAWVSVQRLTLPLAIFFRFHSGVVCIELWKEVYEEEDDEEEDEGSQKTDTFKSRITSVF